MKKLLGAVLGALLVSGTAGADTIASDRAAALVVYPGLIVLESVGADALIQISNTSNEPVAVKCFYVNALGQCSTSGHDCFTTNQCTSEFDTCLPRWAETDFRVFLTARQPLAWQASVGLPRDKVPLNGTFTRGPGGQSNAGTHVPPFGNSEPTLGGQAAIGELKCYAINADGTPSDRNVLKGEVTLVRTVPGIDVAKSNAIGIQAIPGANNGDNQLVLGGDGAEYNGCPNALILNHFFDGAQDPIVSVPVNTFLTLIPCTENFLTQVPTRIPAQYLVFNEFEQRFSTSKAVECFFTALLSNIDTANSSRSVFNVGVAGTLTGQTRIRGVGGGLLGVATEFHGTRGATFNLHLQGEREGASDVVTVVH